MAPTAPANTLVLGSLASSVPLPDGEPAPLPPPPAATAPAIFSAPAPDLKGYELNSVLNLGALVAIPAAPTLTAAAAAAPSIIIES